MRLSFKRHHLFRELAALRVEHFAVDQYAGFFHLKQDRNQWLFNFLVHALQGLMFAKLLPQSLVQLQGDISIFRGIRRCGFKIDLVKG